MRAPQHLNSLRALEAAARHLSYVAAAVELCVTPAAVGQLIRGLEDSLGVNLFHRSRSGQARLVLTDTARTAVPDLQAGFDHLAIALERLRTANAYEIITVGVPRAFADKWLLPRINRFREQHSQYDLRVDTSASGQETPSGRAYIGVRYGQGQWNGWESVFLLDDPVFPVCHPKLVARKPPPVCAEDLRSVPLIHDASMASEIGFPSWRTWLKNAGIDGIDSERGIHIDDPAAVVAATVAGSGVALGRSALVAGDLAEGRLIRPFGPPLSHVFGYYAVHRPDHAGRAAVIAFRDWLIDEARTADGPSAQK
ncbi:LysR substrate-binding domain-containing protein [Acidisphaera rubrifaciens]|uniref:Transcriptional regulator LysR n=1 Tax=Acidisphaera rubrifaciens HS-AP3 TaxID=1231350 RepID=A0A0D6P9I0_9PROT|nr:LysR substrate-binding domain-containing protein [Acidisphaera rubrifaciens]GAN78016.1 transcriptional regulator LysR [Acidisphaera rubrifaciens HS-AP3]